jgi:DNA polymerase, archaea type
MHLDDTATHLDMIGGLESRYRVEECAFRTIYGALEGYRVFAGRKVAERIERQTRYEARLYNVDVRQDQAYMAEHVIFLCINRDDSEA